MLCLPKPEKGPFSLLVVHRMAPHSRHDDVTKRRPLPDRRPGPQRMRAFVTSQKEGKGSSDWLLTGVLQGSMLDPGVFCLAPGGDL